MLIFQFKLIRDSIFFESINYHSVLKKIQLLNRYRNNLNGLNLLLILFTINLFWNFNKTKITNY